jgi:hypothetical protein
VGEGVDLVSVSRRGVLGLGLAALAAEARPRVVVSTDIGGTDPDDFQSMVHLLLYADVLEIEGLISSPFGPGRARHILEVIAEYEKDFPALRAHSARYPKPSVLRGMTKEGALESPGAAGVGKATEGSQWIVRCARKRDARPLHVLVWGGIEDLAQALHDAPEILPKLRVYFIGGPNKMWSVDAYDYVERRHPKLWMIEANSTYRGWFVGGRQDGAWGNAGFVSERLAGRGAMGNYFATHLKGTIKMGDSPSVARLVRGVAEDPGAPGWGGRFVRIWDGRKSLFDRLTTEADVVEVFGVVEFALRAPEGFTERNRVRVMLDNRVPCPVAVADGVMRFRFSPRDAKVWRFRLESDHAGVDGLSGAFTAERPPAERSGRASVEHPNWWCDDQAAESAEGIHAGARSVSRWREEFLEDFARRMERCAGRR